MGKRGKQPQKAQHTQKRSKTNANHLCDFCAFLWPIFLGGSTRREFESTMVTRISARASRCAAARRGASADDQHRWHRDGPQFLECTLWTCPGRPQSDHLSHTLKLKL